MRWKTGSPAGLRMGLGRVFPCLKTVRSVPAGGAKDRVMFTALPPAV
jgi:hypothetical protein